MRTAHGVGVIYSCCRVIIRIACYIVFARLLVDFPFRFNTYVVDLYCVNFVRLLPFFVPRTAIFGAIET